MNVSNRMIQAFCLLLLSACSEGSCARAEDSAARSRLAMTLNPPSVTVTPGDSVALNLTVSEGEPESLRWYSADPSIATVDEAGPTVFGVGEGATRVWAVAGSDSTSAIVVVEAPALAFVQSPQRIFFDALGASLQIEIIATGQAPLPEGDLAPFCLPDNASVAGVDRGMVVTSVGNGSTHIRCIIDSAEDSTLVSVRQRITRVRIAPSAIRPVRLADDSIVMMLARVDRLGVPVDDVEPSWQSLNPRILRVDPRTGVATGVSLGSARIVGELEGLADTVRIDVVETLEQPETSGLPPLQTVGLDEQEETLREQSGDERPLEGDLGPLEEDVAVAEEDPRIQEIIQGQPQDVTATAGSGIGRFQISGLVGLADHRVDIGLGTEKTDGPIFGAQIRLRPAPAISLRGRVYFGSLTTSQLGVDDRDVSEFSGVLGYAALPFFDLEVGTGLRSYNTTFGTQRWGWISTGGNAHLDALNGTLRGHVSLALLPAISVSLLEETPSLGVAAGAGVSLRSGRFTAGLVYELERYEFPAQAGVERIEQFAVMRFNIGLALGSR